MIRSLPIMNVTNIIVSACTMTSSLSVLMDEVYEVDITHEEYLSSFSDSLVEVLFKGLEAKRAGT
jgi:TetR/AcrR family transcriptional regulator